MYSPQPPENDSQLTKDSAAGPDRPQAPHVDNVDNVDIVGRPAAPAAADGRSRTPVNQPGPRTGGAASPAPHVDNIDNVGIAGSPGAQGQPRPPAGAPFAPRTRPFGRPITAPPTLAAPAQAPRRPGPHVDNVDNVGGGGLPQGAGGSEIDRTLHELDLLDDLTGAPAKAPAPRAAEDVEPTRLRAAAPSAPRPADRGRQGPSREAVEVVQRAAARAKLARRGSEAGVAPGAGSVPSRSERARPGTEASQATLTQYLRRGNQMFDRYRRELDIRGGVEDVSPIEFVNWMLTLKPAVKSSTWRMYRQSAIHFLEGVPDAEEAMAMLETDVIDRSREAPPAPPADQPVTRRTSALKEKRFPWEDYDRVTTYLARFSRSKVARILVDWLRAGILTGLRPTEWRATDLEIVEEASAPHGRRAWLYVLNAKATNGRGTGVVRTLDLSLFGDEDLGCVERMVKRGREWLDEGRFADAQAQCSALLYAATEKLWPRRRFAYALYSTRHQAIANWKATLPPDRYAELAAMVGHGVTATAAEHYGKRRNAWPPDKMPPLPRAVHEEVAMVRQRMKLFEQRIALEQRAGLRRPDDNPVFPVGG